MNLYTGKKREELSIPVAGYLPRSRVNGPGLRSVLWVQGCPFRCSDCFNPAFLNFGEAKFHTVASVSEWIVSEKATEGVTFSGGEPFAHAEGLSALARAVQRAGKSVVVFTGYTKGELFTMNNRFQKELLEASDLLIAGRYRKNYPGNCDLLSSTNQEFIHMSSRYIEHEFEIGRKKVEYLIRKDGEISVTGFPLEAQ